MILAIQSPLEPTYQASGRTAAFGRKTLPNLWISLCMHAYPLFRCMSRADGWRKKHLLRSVLRGPHAGFGRGADVLFEEFGATSQMCAEDVTERYYLTTLYALLAEGVTGAMGWCYGDFSVGDQLPYETTPYEVGFGLVDRVGRPKGAGRAMAEFCKVLDMAGGEVMQKAEVGAAVVVQRRYYQNYDPDVTPARNFRAPFNSYAQPGEAPKPGGCDIR